jgi:hypothetical protein
VRALLVGLTTLGAVLTFVAPARAACELNLILIPCLEAAFPGDVALGANDAGTTVTSPEQIVTVSSNQSWGLRIASDAADGRMREWDGGAYPGGGSTLGSPLNWGLTSIAGAPQSPSYTALSSTAASVVSGQSQTGCILGLTCGTRTVGVRLRQAFTYADVRLSPRVYRARVTYTASHGF